MTTPTDLAQQFELAEYIETQRRAIMPKPVRESAKYCRDVSCGAEIPEARRKAVPGTQYCAECKARRQHQARMKGR